ncbi:esterase, PHB depolymerase family [Tritonibacter multivorans]|uniref:Esterase, PHB depolymerase family n=1 Tax=Tritonibacter multivorans TaxID=928856 RepID=A0A0P1H0R2_9RHOB|nr:polyhydroxybutyrate depolymerase [Tritonibacter multivorans]MDA7420568.1 polyhydroxybutyrate depolymerase [Tritonibacter multivorans]CUH81358.1 esterase, PHB depolymerase family [Tritonibacter multivorans]SFC33650.1 polyhydroxybutyrate depolymerase [Tritonibacter multivorans]
MKIKIAGAIAGFASMFATGFATGATACGTGETCTIDSGIYEIALPKNSDGAPVVVFLHGYGGSGANVMRMRGVVEAVTARGYAMVAPYALPRPNGNRSWAFISDFGERDDMAFLRDVVRDAAGRFNTEEQNVVLAGFSAGAFMVNYGACADADAFAAYAPIAGGFWRPQPQTCDGPIRMYHAHGWNDGVVPLEGRILGGGRWEQGDIWAGLELWREANGCDTHAPTMMQQDGDLMIRSWDCGAGAEITFELFPGGHQVPRGWADRMLDWYQADPGRPEG